MNADKILVEVPLPEENHNCANLFILCSDFRFHRGVAELERYLKISAADVIRVPGGLKDLVDDWSGVQEAISSWIKLLCEKHGTKNVYLIAHLECAAYAEEGIRFIDPAEDQEFHRRELAKARRWIGDLVPTVKIITIVARINRVRRKIEFVEVD